MRAQPRQDNGSIIDRGSDQCGPQKAVNGRGAVLGKTDETTISKFPSLKKKIKNDEIRYRCR